MLLNLERLDILIAEYAAGSLPEPAQVVIASHLEMSATSRLFAQALETIGGDTLDHMETSQLTSRDQRLAAVLESNPLPSDRNAGSVRSLLPSPLRHYAGADLQDIPWKTKLPGFKQHIISQTDEAEASLLWVRPGRALPHHKHGGLELTLVLDGDFHDHRGRFGRGEVSIADESFDHRPVAGTGSPCVCFSVLFAPIALSGSKLRLMGDILGV